MPAWVLVPCLVELRNEFNLIAPDRDKTSDGSIGDDAHQDSISDHNADEVGRVPIRDADKKNEVHAIDVDADLHVTGLSMEDVVQFILARCRRKNDDPLNEARLRYIIYNRRIWQAPNWEQRNYTGKNPHDQHAHFSAEYITALEADTSSWHLEEIPVALTDADKKWLSAQIDKAATTAAERVWKTKWNINFEPGSTPYIADAGSILAHVPGEHSRIEAALAETPEP